MLMQCPGSANLELAIPGWVQPPRKTGGARDAGTDAHAIIEPITKWDADKLREVYSEVAVFTELHWRERRKIAEDGVSVWDWVAKTFPTHHQQSQEYLDWFIQLGTLKVEILRGIRDALQFMHVRVLNLPARSKILAEIPMTAHWLRTQPGTTPDVVILTSGAIEIIDWKSGKIPVEALDNDQLLFYAACAYEQWKLQWREWDSQLKIRMSIVQPGHASSWVITLGELLLWMDKARKAEQKILDKDLTLTIGKSCTYCPANPHGRGEKAAPYCPVMMQFLYPQFVDEVGIYEGL